MSRYFLMLLFSLSLFAQPISGEFEVLSEKKVSMGDTFNARILINNLDMSPIKLDPEKDWSPSFQVVNIISQGASKSVSGNFELELLVVLKAPIKSESFTIDNGTQQIPIYIRNLDQFDKNTIQIPKDFIVLEQDAFSRLWTAERKKWLLIISLVFILLSFPFWKKWQGRRAKIAEQRRISDLKDFWRTKIHAASKREDFEELYQSRRDWQKLLEVEAVSRSFLETLNEYQFKPEWNEYEMDQIQRSFDKFKQQVGHGV